MINVLIGDLTKQQFMLLTNLSRWISSIAMAIKISKMYLFNVH